MRFYIVQFRDAFLISSSIVSIKIFNFYRCNIENIDIFFLFLLSKKMTGIQFCVFWYNSACKKSTVKDFKLVKRIVSESNAFLSSEFQKDNMDRFIAISGTRKKTFFCVEPLRFVKDGVEEINVKTSSGKNVIQT